MAILNGSSDTELILGLDNENDLIIVFAGDDTVESLGGNDTIYGEEGDDSLLGGIGADEIYGGDDDDTLDGISGRDSLYGNAGNDSILGGDDVDLLIGGDGSDTISGDDGNDYILGNNSNDVVEGGAGNDNINGNEGEDVLLAGTGEDTVRGGKGNDTVGGGLGDDSVYGDAGNDSITGGDGADSIYGNDGNDIIFGNLKNDTIYGGNGEDVIHGNEGLDTINGNAGNDIITGDAGKDLIRGGKNDDIIDAGADNDLVYGELGNDTIIAGTGADTVYGGAGDDVIHTSSAVTDITAGSDFISAGADNDKVIVAQGVTTDAITIKGGKGNDTIDASAENVIANAHQAGLDVNGNIGNDSILGGVGSDTIHGGRDNDVLVGNNGADYLFGDKGNDIIIGGEGNDTIDGGDGEDTVSFIGNFLDYTQERIAGGAAFKITDTVAGRDGVDVVTADFFQFADQVFSVPQLVADSGVQLPPPVSLDFTFSSSTDNFIGGIAGDKFIVTDNSNFVQLDIVSAALGTDTIEFATASNVITSELTNKTGIDVLSFLAGGNSIALSDSFVSSAEVIAGQLLLSNAANSITNLDTSDVTTVTNKVVIGGTGQVALADSAGNRVYILDGVNGNVVGGSGVDSIYGGDGEDQFTFSTTNLTSVDIIDGATGTDSLTITTSGSADVTGISNVENILLSNSIAITYNVENFNTTGSTGDDEFIFGVGGLTALDTIDGNGGSDTISLAGGSIDIANVSDVDVITSSAAMLLVVGSDDLSIVGSGANDTIHYDAADLTAADTVDGGAGTDQLVIDAGGTAALDGVVNIELLSLSNASNILFGSVDLSTTGSAAADTFSFNIAEFTTADTINGNGGVDTIRFLDSGTINIGTEGVNITNINNISLAASSTVTFNTTNFNTTGSAVVDVFNFSTSNLTALDTISGGAGSDIINLTGAGTANATNVYAVEVLNLGSATTITVGANNFNISGSTGNDDFIYTSTNFTSSDTIAGGGGSDDIIISDAATIIDGDFIQVSGVASLVLGDFDAQSVAVSTLSDAAGLGTIDASALTGTNAASINATGRANAITVLGGAGADTITSGNNNDSIVGNDGNNDFQFISANLTLDDTVTGGVNADDLVIITSANIIDSDFTNITSVENINLSNFNAQTVTLGALSEATGILTLNASGVTGTNTIALDASARTTAITATFGTGADVFTGSLGNDNITSNNGNDSFSFLNARFTSADTISAGGDTDKVVILDAATIVDADFTNITALETIELSDFNAQTLTLGALSDAAGVNYVNASALAGNTVNIDASARTIGVIVDGGSGNDTFTAGSGNERISLLTGDDDIIFASANFTSLDTITGSAGTDEIIISDAASIVDADFTNILSTEILRLGDFNSQSVILGVESNTSGLTTVDASALTGTNTVYVDLNARTDGLTVTTAAGADTIVGSQGSDIITSNGGADDIIFAAANFTSQDTISAGAGTDEVIINDAALVVDSDFTNVTSIEQLRLSDFDNQTIILSGASDAAGLTNVNAVALTGTNQVTVNASGRANSITVAGGAGDDSITSSVSNDDLTGNGGDDDFTFTSATFTFADTVSGGAGTDEIVISDAATIVDTDYANKTSIENIVLADGNGQSVQLGGFSQAAGVVNVNASAVSGVNTVVADFASRTNNMTYVGGNGVDTITTGSGNGNYTGNGGNDVFNFLSGNFTVNDTIVGGAGTDIINFTDAASIVDTDFTNISATERLVFSDFNAQSVIVGTLSDAAGINYIDFSALTGANTSVVDATGKGNSITIIGGTGQDIFATGAGIDSISTAGGNDFVTITDANLSSGDTIDGGAGTDSLIITTAATTINDNDFTNISAFETLTLGDFDNQSLTLSGLSVTAGITTIDASALTGTNDVDINASGRISSISFTGGNGNDTISSTLSDDLLFGNGGADTFQFLSTRLTSSDTITGGGGADIIEITDAATVIDSDFTNVSSVNTLTLADFSGQSISLSALSEAAGLSFVDATSLTGTNSVTIDASARTNTTILSGGNGNDTIDGSSGIDIVSGGGGDDNITARAGNDILSGGADRDSFNFIESDGTHGIDSITDWVSADDAINLTRTAEFVLESVNADFLSADEYVEVAGAISGDLSGSLNVANDIIVLTDSAGGTISDVGNALDVSVATGASMIIWYNTATTLVTMAYDDDVQDTTDATIISTFANVGNTSIAASFSSGDFFLV